MATTIKLKNGSGAPLAGDLVQGEPALDLTNKRLYTENASGTVIEVGTNPSTLTVDTTTLVVDATNNKVGIGTASPSNILHISSSDPTIRLQDTDATGYCLINAASNSRIQIKADEGNNDANTTIEFHVDGSERMRIDSSGNVGIGTTSPSSYNSIMNDLVVAGSADSGITIASGTSSEGSIAFADGTSGADAYRGWINYNHNSNFMRFSTNATERMRIDSSGKVGIGTSSPAEALNIVGTGGTAKLRFDGDTSNLQNNFIGITGYDDLIIASDEANSGSASTIQFRVDAAEAMRISDAGNVYIGTTNTWFTASGRKILRVHGAAGGSFLVLDTSGSGDFYIGSENNGLVNFWNQANGDMVFATNNTERMRILPSGNIGMGLSSDYYSAKLAVGQSGGNPALACRTTSTSGTVPLVIFTDGNSQDCGSIDVDTSANTTNYGTASDQRLKENIVDAPSGNIDDVRVRSFDWKSSGHHQTYGLVAQELVDVAPEAVAQGKKEEDTWKVDYSKLVPMMIKEIQDLKAEVAALKGA